MNRTAIVAKIEEIAERAGQPEGIEVVEVDLKGTGPHQVLRIIIDKPAGVTHGDCEFISQQVSAILDADDFIHGAYHLEVSSPGVERKLLKWKDWERFVGKKVKVVLRKPVAAAVKPGELTHFDGIIRSAENQTITAELKDETQVTFPFEQVDRANLKFEW
jgi:ribosome maturation factor RimP